jgi:hypothetical protein
MSRFDRGAGLPGDPPQMARLPEFPWDSSIASDEEIERARSAVFVQTVHGVTPALEIYFIRAMLALRSKAEGDKRMLAFAWRFLEQNLGALIEHQFRNEYDRENWAAVRERALTEIFGLSSDDLIWREIGLVPIPAWTDVVKPAPRLQEREQAHSGPKCRAILLCESVTRDELTHKTNITGIFDTFYLDSIPGETSPFSVFLQFDGSTADIAISAEIQDVVSELVLFRASMITGAGEEISIPIDPLRFDRFGDYDLVLFGNESEFARHRFRIRESGL